MPFAVSSDPFVPFDWRRPATWGTSGRAVTLALWAVLGLGALLRLAVWQQARSLYLDEANLVRNFAERTYGGLFRPLGYEQYAPPIFSILMKAATDAFGYGERAIRLVPLLASLAGLVVFGALAKRWLSGVAAVLAAGFFGWSSIYLDFATAAKQYSSDVLLVLLVLFVTDRQLQKPTLSTRAAGALALGGATAIWASMPVVFALAGAGMALAWQYLYQQRPAERGPVSVRLALMGVCWAGSFGAYFLLLLHTDARATNLQQFHDDYFLPFPPRSAADWTLIGHQLSGLIDRGFGKTGLAIALGGLGLLGGMVGLIRRHPARAVLLLVPPLSALAASAMHYYSLVPRLMLFALPLLLLVLMTGLDAGLRRPWVGLAVLGAVLATLGNQQRLSAFWQPFQADYADVRAGLRHVAAHQRPGELLMANANVAPVALHYLRLAPLDPPLGAVWLEPYREVGGDSALFTQDIGRLVQAGHRRLWLVSNLPDPWLRRWAAATGTVSQEYDFYRGYAFLYEAR